MEDNNWTKSSTVERKHAQKSEMEYTTKKENKETVFKINPLKYQSFGLYLKCVLKTSLITSIPEIAVNKSWTKRIIKILVLIISLVGFLYQTSTFLQIYWTYPTIATSYVTNLPEMIQPAITICNNNRKRRTFICSLGDTCSFTEKDEFCKRYPKWCPTSGIASTMTGMCSECCKINKLLELDLCIDKSIQYPHDFFLCKKGKQTLTNDIERNCNFNCREACHDQLYDVQIEKVGNFDNVCKDEWCRVRWIKITLQFKQFRITKSAYQPKFESVEMFSYIGGYMGMWLGVSLVSLFDLFETVCYLLFYPIKRKKDRKSRHSIKPEPMLQDKLSFGTNY